MYVFVRTHVYAVPKYVSGVCSGPLLLQLCNTGATRNGRFKCRFALVLRASTNGRIANVQCSTQLQRVGIETRIVALLRYKMYNIGMYVALLQRSTPLPVPFRTFLAAALAENVFPSRFTC